MERKSIHDRDADQVRKAKRGGEAGVDRPEAEANDTMREAWSRPGGEAHNYRNATRGAGGKADGHDDLTAAETPETHAHLSDPTLAPDDTDATGEAIARMRKGGR